MSERSKLDLLVGKCFIAPYPHADGVVVAVLDEDFCFVRFDAGADGPPEAFAVVALSDMAKAGYNSGEDEVAPWLFFDSAEQRAKYRAWLNNPGGPNKPRIVPLRRKEKP